MNRRFFIAGACAAVALWPVRVEAQQDGDWTAFERLAAAFNALLSATDPIAEAITRRKFRRLLRSVARPVARIVAEKETVLLMLQHPTCAAGASPARLARARASALAIGPLVDQLALDVAKLADAVRPPGIAGEIRAIASGLRAMEVRKMWIHRVDEYCDPSRSEQRLGFRREVAASRNIVRQCQRQIDLLIDALS